MSSVLAASQRVPRAQLTLSLIRRAVVELGRAVRVQDVWAHAQQHASSEIQLAGMTTRTVRDDIAYLLSRDTLAVITRLRGPGPGRALVVPRELAAQPDRWRPAKPITWLDYVASHARALAREVDSRDRSGQRAGFTTQQLRERLTHLCLGDRVEAVALYGVHPAAPLKLAEALGCLALGRDPLLRRAACRREVWTLASSDAATASSVSTYARDSDRIIEAARRIVLRNGRNIVSAAEVAREMAIDAALQPRSPRPVYLLMSQLARTDIDSPSGVRRVQRMRRLGRVGSQIGYWVSTGDDDENSLAEATAVVALEHLAVRLKAGRFAARLASLEFVQSPIVRLGRLRQVRMEVVALLAAASQLAQSAHGLDDLRIALQVHLDAADAWLTFRGPGAGDAPEDVQPQPGGLTHHELRDLLAPLSTLANSLKQPSKKLENLAKAIRRIPNPNYVRRGSSRSRERAQFLFDDADALTFIACRFGGSTCQLLALWGFEEVGELRDPRYIYAALRVATPEQRIRLVSGLALMRAKNGERALIELLQSDSDSGVRESALWSLGLLAGERSTEELGRVRDADPDHRVRQAAARFLAMGDGWWWRV